MGQKLSGTKIGSLDLESTVAGSVVKGSCEKFRQFLRKKDGFSELDDHDEVDTSVSTLEKDLEFLVESQNGFANFSKEALKSFGQKFFLDAGSKIPLSNPSQRAKLAEDLKRIEEMNDDEIEELKESLQSAKDEIQGRLVQPHQEWIAYLIEVGAIKDRSGETFFRGWTA